MASREAKLIRVLLFQEGDFWIAQCLEHDIAAQSRTEAGARDAFLRSLNAQRNLDAIKPAPDLYFEAYEQAEELPNFLRIPNAYIAQAKAEQHSL